MIDLQKARILVTNDDGIDAPGLHLLESLARQLSDDVWVVAPKQEQSGAGHSLTLRRPLRIEKRDERHFAVDGTPTDCVLLGIQQVLHNQAPDLVLSGVNRGGNLSEDVTYSGTIAAAMEATLLGVPAIAFSQVVPNGGPVNWSVAERHLLPVARRLIAAGWPEGVLINVNFPDCPPEAVSGTRITHQGQRKIGDHIAERIDPRGQAYYWIGAIRAQEPDDPASDLVAVAENAISITPVTLDFTHHPTRDQLRKAFR